VNSRRKASKCNRHGKRKVTIVGAWSITAAQRRNCEVSTVAIHTVSKPLGGGVGPVNADLGNLDASAQPSRLDVGQQSVENIAAKHARRCSRARVDSGAANYPPLVVAAIEHFCVRDFSNWNPMGDVIDSNVRKYVIDPKASRGVAA
jgi:hypothetical protein